MARSFTRTITTPAAARMVRPHVRPIVSMLTDFGARDPSAGIMRAVVAGIAPDAPVIDISHEVEKFRVRDAALLLWCSVPYLPMGAHMAVVDPGVGTERRAIAIETARGDFLVGPDNGILLPAASRLGGITRVHLLTSVQYRLPVISSSFHGRDLFAPAAAHLAMGLPLEFLGPSLDPRGLVHLDWPEPQIFAGILRTQVIYLDTFGNVKLSALGPDLQAAVGHLQYGERLWIRLTDPFGSNDVEVTWADTFGRVGVGQLLLTEDSYGRLSMAINQGSAVEAIGVREDAEVLVTRMQLPRTEVEPGVVAPAIASASDVPVAVPAWAGDQPPAGWAPPVDAGWSQPAQTGWGVPAEAGWAPPVEAATRPRLDEQPWAPRADEQPWGPGPEQPGWAPPAEMQPVEPWSPPQNGAGTHAQDEPWGPALAPPWGPSPPEPAQGPSPAGDPWGPSPAGDPWGPPPASADGSAVPPSADAPAADEPRSSRRWRR